MADRENRQSYRLALRPTQEHNHRQRFIGAPMLVTFVLSLFNRTPAFAWSPALDLSDNQVISTLIPGTQY
jgi:hypothetical protein